MLLLLWVDDAGALARTLPCGGVPIRWGLGGCKSRGSAESRAASCPAAGSLINTAESCSGKLLHPHYCDAVQLYHLPTDPQEQHSLAGMAEHAARVHGLTTVSYTHLTLPTKA